MQYENIDSVSDCGDSASRAMRQRTASADQAAQAQTNERPRDEALRRAYRLEAYRVCDMTNSNERDQTWMNGDGKPSQSSQQRIDEHLHGTPLLCSESRRSMQSPELMYNSRR